MKIGIDNHWLAQSIGQKSDKDLSELYREIVEFRRIGVLPSSSVLRNLSKELEKEENIPDSFLRSTEDAVLYEMARRYHNLIQLDEESVNE